MARDRKRAKQRQQRRAKAGALPRPAPTHHENVPGSLEHASGEVEEFDAALIAGAQGEAGPPTRQLDADDDAGAVPGSPTGPTSEAADQELDAPEVQADAPEVQADASEVGAEASQVDDRELESAALAAGASARASSSGGTAAGTVDRGRPTPSTPAAAPGENRVLSFLRASWSELQRVQWPDRRAVAQATGVVLGFVVIAGAYLGLADLVASKIVDAIL